MTSINDDMDLVEVVPTEVSPYDAAYPIALLSNGIKAELVKAQTVAENIYRAVIREMPVVAQVGDAVKTGCRYVVDTSESTLKAIESGALKLTQENGRTYAQLKVNGKYGSKLPIALRLLLKHLTRMANPWICNVSTKFIASILCPNLS